MCDCLKPTARTSTATCSIIATLHRRPSTTVLTLPLIRTTFWLTIATVLLIRLSAPVQQQPWLHLTFVWRWNRLLRYLATGSLKPLTCDHGLAPNVSSGCVKMSPLVSQVFYLSNSIYLIYLVVEYYFIVCNNNNNNNNSSIASFELFIQNLWFVSLAHHLLKHLASKQQSHLFNYLKQLGNNFASADWHRLTKLSQPNTTTPVDNNTSSITHFQLIGQFHLIKQLLLSKDFGNCFRNNNWFSKAFIGGWRSAAKLCSSSSSFTQTTIEAGKFSFTSPTNESWIVHRWRCGWQRVCLIVTQIRKPREHFRLGLMVAK